MRLTIVFLCASGALLSAASAVAGDDYRCTIEKVATPTENSGSVQKMLAAYYVGKIFTAERRTGLMAGALKNTFEKPPTVVDEGSEQSSFKVVTTLTVGEPGVVGSSIKVLVVNEFAKSDKKPFLFLDIDNVYSGTCKHF